MNLEQYLVSGSKTVTAVNGKVSARGSYTSVQKWLNKQGSEVPWWRISYVFR